MINNINWENNQLEPVLITYNRSSELQKTLNAFIDANLTNINLHVLDNASTDDTKAIVAAARLKWPNLKYHRNRYNVGGNANILRAVEISTSEYSWILGDDDDWHLEDIGDLSTTLKLNKADIIRLGWLVSEKSRGNYLELLDILKVDQYFYASISMISATIIRRSIILEHLPHAYMAVADAYPQLLPILRSVTRRSLQVYTLKHDIMTHTPSTTPGYYFGDLEWYCSWFRMSRFIENNNQKSRFVGEVLAYMTRSRPGRVNEFIWLVKVSFNFKALGVDQWPYILSMLAYGVG